MEEKKCNICGRSIEQFGDVKNEKCILHCKKNDWYDEINDGKKDWSNSKDEIKEFWKIVFELWKEGKTLEKVFFPPINELKEFDLDELSNVSDSSDLRTKNGIFFEFNKFIKISNSTFLGNFKLNYKFKFKGILFDEETKFLGDLEINNITIETKLQFIYVTFHQLSNFVMINNIELEFLNTTFIGISNFQNLINLKKLEIVKSPKIKNITILNSHIKSVDIRRNDEFNKLEIHNTTFHKEFKFVGYNKKTLVKKTILNETYFSINPNGKSKPDFKFIETTFNKEMYFSIIDLAVKNLEFVYCTINDRIILSSKGKWYNESNLFQHSALHNLRFFHSIKKPSSEIYVNIKKITTLIFDEELSSGKIVIKDLDDNRKLTLKESNLVDALLINCDFSNSDINIIHSLLFSGTNQIIFNNTKWPSIYDMTNCDRDTFRQLKQAYEQQGNFIEANKFYSAEMEAYKEELKDKKNKHRWQDRVIFWLNEKVSNFPQNWILPLAWYFVFGFLFAFVYNSESTIFKFQGFISTLILFLSIILFGLDFKKLKDFKRNLNLLIVTSGLNYFMNVPKASLEKLFLFINPLNTSGLIDNKPRLIWWILFRIISVFIIYQFIISLRRQTRR